MSPVLAETIIMISKVTMFLCINKTLNIGFGMITKKLDAKIDSLKVQMEENIKQVEMGA